MFEYLSNVNKVEALTADDIMFLIDQQVPENKRLDYKLLLDIDKKKGEFLKDITSFYNTEGGVIIFGLQEKKVESSKTGIPELPTRPGLAIANFEDVKLSITSSLKTGTNPSMNAVYFSALLDVSGHQVFAIGIPKNNSLPVMVIADGINCFFRRNNTQKYFMETLELYNAFLRNNAEGREIATFVEKRSNELYNPYFGVRQQAPQAVIHLIHPDYLQNVAMDGFFAPDFLPFAKTNFNPDGYDLKLKHAYGFNGLHLLADPKIPSAGSSLDGTLLFRNGVIEIFNTTLFSEWETNVRFQGSFFCNQFETVLARNIKSALALYDRWQISPSFYISIVLKNLAGCSLNALGGRIFGKFQNNELHFPLLFITGPSEIENAVKLLFDILFQSVGEAECPTQFKASITKLFASL